jgi:nitroreductase
MEKPAKSDHDIHPLIKRRWSPRAFDPRPVERDKLLRILEAARWAASSNNEQPWTYLLATQENPAEFAKMLACLVPGNQAWAQHAPVLMISVAKTFFDRNQQPNRVALHDVGAASAQLTGEALNQGLFVHQMAGIEPDKIRADYQLPPGHEPVAALAIGYPGNPDTLPEPFKSRETAERTRKPISQFVFTDTWGSSAF